MVLILLAAWYAPEHDGLWASVVFCASVAPFWLYFLTERVNMDDSCDRALAHGWYVFWVRLYVCFVPANLLPPAFVLGLAQSALAPGDVASDDDDGGGRTPLWIALARGVAVLQLSLAVCALGSCLCWCCCCHDRLVRRNGNGFDSCVSRWVAFAKQYAHFNMFVPWPTGLEDSSVCAARSSQVVVALVLFLSFLLSAAVQAISLCFPVHRGLWHVFYWPMAVPIAVQVGAKYKCAFF